MMKTSIPLLFISKQVFSKTHKQVIFEFGKVKKKKKKNQRAVISSND